MIKAVFFDIDGTLVSFNTHKVPESTMKAFELLHEKGIKTICCNRKTSFNYVIRQQS